MVDRLALIVAAVVYFGARPTETFARCTLPGAQRVPADAPADGALEKAPLPRNDFNTRIVIFGQDGAQARRLADAIGKTPFQNVSYYAGRYDQLVASLEIG